MRVLNSDKLTEINDCKIISSIKPTANPYLPVTLLLKFDRKVIVFSFKKLSNR